MQSRTLLAILHFNENSEREHTMTKEGEHRYRIKASKTYKGEHVALPIKEEPIFNYFHQLIDKAVDLCNEWPTFDAAFEANPDGNPLTLTESNPAPEKYALVAQRLHRLEPCHCLQFKS
ncbi:uncharacterized protein LOC135395491 [Ornithodoros turicata]|uniref:uncharacterized protein LOC135395491 n=1 Tax=Ornithodoros turicata TaxID=34597 RepID=UPI0031394E6D